MKVISSKQTAGLVRDCWTVSTSGFTGSGHPEGLSAAIENRFLETGHPRALLRVQRPIVNPDAVVSHGEQFDFYDGGGLDLAFLGLAQVDVQGNVNVSRFGTRIAGIGGFVNITQTSKEVVFMGSLTAKGLEVEAADGRLRVRRERAVFEMRGGRLTLTEIAPGIDLEREVRAQIAPGVGVAEDLKTMDARIFRAQPVLRRP